MRNDNNGDSNRIRRKKISSSPSKTPSKDTHKKVRTSGNGRRKRKRKFSALKITFLTFLALFVVGVALVLGVGFSSLKDLKNVSAAELDKRTHVTTTILYSNGEKMSTAPSVNKKTPVMLNQISPYLQKAVVAIEDERFYQHIGVDFIGLARSVVNTLTGNMQGGSTLDMQVSKMLYTSTEQTITRKIKDIYYAIEIDRKVSKDKILETYLNNFFVGKGLSGAEAGARGYFDKSAKDLTLAESALLAGSTKNPSKYSAYKTAKLDGTETKEELDHRLITFTNTEDDDLDEPTETELQMIDKIYEWGMINEDKYKRLKAQTLVIRKAVNNPDAKERQETVLWKMKELGYISQKEYTEALAEEIVIRLPESSDGVSSSVEDVIESEVISALMEQGNTREEATNMYYNGGLVINTTIDPKIQDSIETEYKNNNNFPGNKIGPDGVYQPQSATVILDHSTGQIKGLVGGRNITGRKTLNRALTPRQPGSTIKPLAVYTPAIDTMSITQATAFSDAKGGYRFEKNRSWNPSTTTAGSGSMSLRLGLAKSSNTVAVKVAELLGDSYDDCVDIMIDYLNNFGITTLADNKATSDSNNTDRTFPALTLGGLTYGISPLELASAYGALANGGVYIEPTIFTTIETFDNQTLVKSSPEKHKVVDPEVAYVMTDMLKAVITEGTAGKAQISGGMPVAGKTGTTNSSKEAWFVGYTPYYVGATYIADDAGVKDENGNVVPTRNIGGGSSSSAILWQKIMTRVHKNLEVKDFEVPDNIYFEKINLQDGGASSSGSKAAFIEGTSATRVTTMPSKPSSDKAEENTNNETTSGDGNDGGDGNSGNSGSNNSGSEKPDSGSDNGGDSGNSSGGDSGNSGGENSGSEPSTEQ